MTPHDFLSKCRNVDHNECTAFQRDFGDSRAGLVTDDEVLARLFRLNQERAGR